MAAQCTLMAVLHEGPSQSVSFAPLVIEDLQVKARILRDFLPLFEGQPLDGQGAQQQMLSTLVITITIPRPLVITMTTSIPAELNPATG